MRVVLCVVLHNLTIRVVLVVELLRDGDGIVYCLLPLARSPVAEKTQFRIILLLLCIVASSLLFLVLFFLLCRFSIGSLCFRFFVYATQRLRLNLLFLLCSVLDHIISLGSCCALFFLITLLLFLSSLTGLASN